MSKLDMRLVQNNPNISKKRSYMPNMKFKSQLDFNMGLLVPLSKPIEVLPGDTFKVKHALSLRMTNPPKVPVFDQLAFDLFFFYSPLRILWDKFDEFITGDVGTDWTQVSNLTIPKIICDYSHYCPQNFPVGSLFDFIGCPYKSLTAPAYPEFNALPFRNYYKIWNWWFRYEPLQEELYFDLDSDPVYFTPGNSVSGALQSDIYDPNHVGRYMEALRSNAVTCGWLAPVCKLSDVFTRCLPQPLAGPDIPILNFSDTFGLSKEDGLLFGFVGTGSAADTVNLTSDVRDGFSTLESAEGGIIDYIKGDLTGISGNTIRALREAFAIEQVFTIEGRYSRRLPDWSVGMFGVNVPDYRVQQPELLGQTRIYLNLNQVIQSSASEANSPQGNVGAWSETKHSGFDFVKSFCEFGYIQPVGCIRVLNRTYSQGTDRLFRRDTRFDFYMPPLANISDQPVLKQQLYNGSDYVSVFGYQEAWYDYKYLPNHVANHCRPDVTNTIAVWNYAEYYSSSPSFSEEFIIEPAYGIDRTMYLNSSLTVSQFILDMLFDVDCYRTMPVHAIPGTLSHFW